MCGVSIQHEVSCEVSERVEILPALVPQADVAHQAGGSRCRLDPHLAGWAGSVEGTRLHQLDDGDERERNSSEWRKFGFALLSTR